MARPFGVGPAVIGPALIWLAVSWLVGTHFPAVSAGLPVTYVKVLGAALVSCGVLLYVVGVRQFRAVVRGDLVTTGLFGWCRHPMYAVWIFLLLPGFAGMVANWVGFAAPFVALALFSILIRHEERDLHARFGQTYPEYCARVGRLWPRRNARGQGVR